MFYGRNSRILKFNGRFDLVSYNTSAKPGRVGAGEKIYWVFRSSHIISTTRNWELVGLFWHLDGSVRRCKERYWEKLGISWHRPAHITSDGGREDKCWIYPGFRNWIFSLALHRLVTAAVSPPRCLHKLNIQSFGAEAAARSSSDVHSHTWQHTFVSLWMRNKNINYPPVATLPFLPLSHRPHIFRELNCFCFIYSS